jgi:hypothetical protein
MEYKRQEKRRKNYMNLFVLNNELTWKRICRFSIYVINIIPKQNKSTKHILFLWIIFIVLINPPFCIIFNLYLQIS